MDSKRASNKANRSWGKNKQKILQLMVKQFINENNAMATTDLLGKSRKHSPSSSNSSGSGFDVEDLDQGQRLPSGWEKNGVLHYVNSEAETRQSSKSIKSRSSEEALDLKSNLQSSKDIDRQLAKDDIIEEAASVMKLVGCSKCLMYSMVSNQDPKCPKCQGSFLIHFSNEDFSYKHVHTMK